jgi:prepilin-type processing-associated H-X9-DG protein
MPISYGKNTHIGPWPGDGTTSLAAVDSPSTKILVTEITGGDEARYGGPWWTGNSGDWANGFAKHLSTMNFLFADGHVKAMRPTATMTPTNMWGRFDDQSGDPVCGSMPRYSPNCDVPASALQGLQTLQAANP